MAFSCHFWAWRNRRTFRRRRRPACLEVLEIVPGSNFVQGFGCVDEDGPAPRCGIRAGRGTLPPARRGRSSRRPTRG